MVRIINFGDFSFLVYEQCHIIETMFGDKITMGLGRIS